VQLLAFFPPYPSRPSAQAHRFLHSREKLALQGFKPSDFKKLGNGNVSQVKFDGMLGNAMSVPVLASAIRAVLLCAGLVTEH
jgi:site-specific DNA-cytosine methylase